MDCTDRLDVDPYGELDELAKNAAEAAESAVYGLDYCLSQLLELIAADEPWEGDRVTRIRDLVWWFAYDWGLPDACIPGDASLPLRLQLDAEDQRLADLALACSVELAEDGAGRWLAEEAWDAACDRKARTLVETVPWPRR